MRLLGGILVAWARRSMTRSKQHQPERLAIILVTCDLFQVEMNWTKCPPQLQTGSRKS